MEQGWMSYHRRTFVIASRVGHPAAFQGPGWFMLKAIPRRMRTALPALFALSVCSVVFLGSKFYRKSPGNALQWLAGRGRGLAAPNRQDGPRQRPGAPDPGDCARGRGPSQRICRTDHRGHKAGSEFADAYNRLGTVLSRFLETDAARNAFEEALALDRKLAAAHVNLALILAEADELSAAHEHLDRAIELEAGNKDAASAYLVRAMVWSAQGDNRNAIVDLKNATQLRPDYAAAWSDLSQLLFSASDLSGALAAAERAVAIDPKDPAAQYQLGRIYLASGNAAAALEHLKAARSLGAEDKSTMYALSRALRSTGHLEEAEAVNRKVIELERQSVNATQVSLTAAGLNDEGLRLENSGDLQAAMAKYKAALDLDPTGYGFRLNYGLALCRLVVGRTVLCSCAKY